MKSLEMSEYYAQPQNAFWRIMGVLFDAGPQVPYGERLGRLTARGVAVWDVLAAGRRPGSLDSSIDAATAVVNDFRSFFASHGGIRLICFNGTKAAELYRRKVLPLLVPPAAALETRILPSTSPAHAALRFDDKLARWAGVLHPVVPRIDGPAAHG
jgi:TDG/mug DNA glycosylase family protein